MPYTVVVSLYIGKYTTPYTRHGGYAMTSKALIESWERDDLPKMLLGERLVYMEMRFLSDRKGTLRLSQTDLSAKLGVTRQAIVKHVDSLTEKRLVRRIGHGRYTVCADPYSLFDAAKDYRATLKPGDEWDAWDLAEIMWGIKFSADTMDPRINEALAYTEMLEKNGRLIYDEMTSVHTIPRHEPPA